MKLALIFALLPLPAAAWEFSPDPICTLSHQTAELEFIITHDVAARTYTLAITLQDTAWQPSPTFGVSYSGSMPINISTIQHRLSDDAKTLTVSDSGFDNVLNGLEFNHTATAMTQSQSLSVRTRGISKPMAAFRACPDAVLPTS